MQNRDEINGVLRLDKAHAARSEDRIERHKSIMIVVTTPTGHIGSQLVPHLLAAGARVRVIAREPEKLSAEVQSRVEVVQGSTDDIKVLSEALSDADALFWVVPPPFQHVDLNAYMLQFTEPACEAITAKGVRRVVGVSSLGHGLAKSALLSPAFAMDEMIERTGVCYRALWCPGFMENILQQVQPIKHQGMFYGLYRPEVKTPLVATCDIAASAARLLLDERWTGQGGLAVLGPEDLSCDDMACIMGEVLGKPFRYQQISPDTFKAQLMQNGASEAMAQGLVDMAAEVNEHGIHNAEPRTPENTTPTTLRTWCDQVLKPAVLSAGQRLDGG
jgi:uncharacterized protein YbjT (DUF2867 family)